MLLTFVADSALGVARFGLVSSGGASIARGLAGDGLKVPRRAVRARRLAQLIRKLANFAIRAGC